MMIRLRVFVLSGKQVDSIKLAGEQIARLRGRRVADNEEPPRADCDLFTQ